MIQEIYETPDFQVIYVKVEQGFNRSGNDGGGVTAPEWGII